MCNSKLTPQGGKAPVTTVTDRSDPCRHLRDLPQQPRFPGRIKLGATKLTGVESKKCKAKRVPAETRPQVLRSVRGGP